MYYFSSLTKREVIKYQDISGIKQQRLVDITWKWF